MGGEGSDDGGEVVAGGLDEGVEVEEEEEAEKGEGEERLSSSSMGEREEAQVEGRVVEDASAAAAGGEGKDGGAVRLG